MCNLISWQMVHIILLKACRNKSKNKEISTPTGGLDACDIILRFGESSASTVFLAGKAPDFIKFQMFIRVKPVPCQYVTSSHELPAMKGAVPIMLDTRMNNN